MNPAQVLKSLFDEKKINVMQVFINDPGEEFALKEVVEESKVSLATTHRILKNLVSEGILKANKHKHLTTYTIAPTQEGSFLAELLYERPKPIAKFVELIRPIAGIQQAILHGEETETRANVVIMGHDIDKDQVNAAVAQVREETRFTLNHLILEPDQFQMLESMGQFSGTRTIIFHAD